MKFEPLLPTWGDRAHQFVVGAMMLPFMAACYGWAVFAKCARRVEGIGRDFEDRSRNEAAKRAVRRG